MSDGGQQNEVWTVGRLLDWTTRWFNEKGVEGGRLSAELLLARAMDCQKIELYTRFDQEPTAEQRTCFRELVKSAAQHTPIAYLLGQREFFSLPLEVEPGVLVPRPETEALVQRAIEICRGSPEHRWQVLDVGTGSGCIAVALARFAENTDVVAGDISDEALAVAARNVESHGLGDRVRLVQADGFNLPEDVVPADGFDLIVSNPPYISRSEWADLPPNVRDHEPQIALLADGEDGTAFHRRLAQESPGVIAEGGTLLTEIGYRQRDAVLELFAAAGGWKHTGTHRDPTDPHDRVLEFTRVAE